MKQILTGSITLAAAMTAFSANGAIKAGENNACIAPGNVDPRPNILWLTFEDSSWYLFGCYGNRYVSTPNIDSLASQGIRFTNAWSTAPQSSPARSTLITGCYATTYGMDVHPRQYHTPSDIFFPRFLREAGYYCTNNSKTHYNTSCDHKAIWDECFDGAGYNSPAKPADAPFFSVFNTVTSHMGRVRTFHTDGRRDYSKEGIYIDSLVLPPHIPPGADAYSDYAGHLESVQDVDTWVGFFLKDLEEKGLSDNTIIFIFSDHGGVLPRGKGYLYETGLRVPLIAWFPEKWRHLAGGMCGGDYDGLTGFQDLGPTVLSLAGIETPGYMHGKALLGQHAIDYKQESIAALTANQHHHYAPVRAITDGTYKYMRTLIPYKQQALRNYYQWGMPANMAWDEEYLRGELPDGASYPFEGGRPETLFLIEKDSFELNNLAADPAHAAKLLQMREKLSQHMRRTGDLGLLPPSVREGICVWEIYNKNGVMPLVWELAELTCRRDDGIATEAIAYLDHEDPAVRYWAAVAMAWAIRCGASVPPQIFTSLMHDPDPYVRAESCYAAFYAGARAEALGKLLAFDKNQLPISYSLIECISLDPSAKEDLMAFEQLLRHHSLTLPARENEDPGLMARGVLTNLGLESVRNIYGEDSYQRGLKLNKGRRPMVPLPK